MTVLKQRSGTLTELKTTKRYTPMDWASLDIRLFGESVPLKSVSSIDWNDNYPEEAIYGPGREIIGYGRKNHEVSADIEIGISEINAIMFELFSSPLTNSFDNVAEFGIEMKVDRLDGTYTVINFNECKLSNRSGSIKQNDANSTVKMALRPMSITYSEQK